mmetsp:Transcript_135172/g.341993  ORF Transcript_135172/g.341993 Transcript_135172/m.341993 type:complete len:202 (+) Transcript_135172:629-1234(+)
MDCLLPELSVVVEAHLGVADKDAAVFQSSQGVDLNHCAVAFDEDLVQIRNECGSLLDLSAGVAHLCGHFRGNLGGHALLDVDRLLDNGGGVGSGDVFNRGATGLATNHQRASATTVHQDRKILLGVNRNLLGEKESVVRLAFRTCLLCDQRLAQHLLRYLCDLSFGDDVHTTLEVVLLEIPQAAASGQDLGFHNDLVTCKL